MHKILIYFSFVIASLVVIVAFVTATTYAQLAIAILIYPLLVCFAFRTFPRKNHCCTSVKPATAIQPPVTAKKVEADERRNLGITDIDKRVFLKLIGGAGLSLFLLSIFNKRAGNLFSKNLPTLGKLPLEDTASNKIDPAQNQLTDGYKISEIDNNVISFYGFINSDGAWFIMKEDSDMGSFRYARGDSNFPGNWANRENLKYDYFNNVF